MPGSPPGLERNLETKKKELGKGLWPNGLEVRKKFWEVCQGWEESTEVEVRADPGKSKIPAIKLKGVVRQTLKSTAEEKEKEDQ